MNKAIKIYLSKTGFILLVASILFSCNKEKTNNQLTQERQLRIIKFCLEKIHKNAQSITYLVNPKFQPFESNSFFRDNRIMEELYKDNNYDYNIQKYSALAYLKWKPEDFVSIQKQINDKFLRETNSKMSSFSTSSKAQFIVSFSGINENLVFADLIQYADSITSSDLNSPNFNRNQRFISATSLIFLLKNNRVEKVLDDCDITNCYQ